MDRPRRRSDRSQARRLLLTVALCITFLAAPAFAFTPSGLLEIHHINIQQGDCTLIIGPDGTTILIDAGNNGKGTSEVVPYLQSLGLMPVDGLDYMIASHRDADHLGGLDDVINAGYDVRDGIWDNGSSHSTQSVTDFLNAGATVTAGPVSEMPLNTIIQLGDGATARSVVVKGNVYGFGQVSGATNNENDMSIGILVQYKDFDYLTAGDLGGGDSDNACTGRSTGQVDVETTLANSLMPGGGANLLTTNGVEVLDINHHGSESSTNSDYMNQLTPSVAAINVGAGQGGTFHHPRQDVVESVLLAQAACVTAPAALVLQTEEGSPTGSNTSFAGYCVGDIIVKTTGLSTYEMSATGAVSQGPDERAAAGLSSPTNFPMDSGGGQPAMIVINEIMQNPASVGDTKGEWVELYNAGASTVDLDGWTIRDDGNDDHTIANGGPLNIAAGGYLVLGRNDNSNQNGGYMADYQYSGFTLGNGADEVILENAQGQIVDRVDYTGGSPWPDPNGASMALNDTGLDNNVGSNWAEATIRGGTYDGSGSDLGTPGAANGGGGGDTEAPVVAVLTPDGGEDWQVGSSQAITWSATDNVGVTSIDIQYSSSGSGGPYNTIATGEANDGTYDWTVPNDPTSNAYVKVIAYDAATNSAEDISNGAFTISSPPTAVLVINEIMANPLSVTDANGEWFEVHNPGGSAVDIEGWTIRDDGSDSHVINNGAPLNVPAGGYLVLGRNGDQGTNGGYVADYVYSSFTLANTEDEVYLVDGGGATVDFVVYTNSSPWPNPDGESIELDDPANDNNVGSNWALATTRGGTFDGSGSDLGTPGAANGGGGGDTEDPVATVLTPNGSESWDAGTQHAITWTATDNVGVTSIDIAYSTTGAGGPFTDIATGEANDGTYTWTVPNDPSSNAFVRVIAYDAASNSGQDVSNAAFTINAAPATQLHVHGLTVDNIPANGGRWSGRATITVHDDSHNPVSGVTVTGDWSGNTTETGKTGVTNGSGVATIDSKKVKNPSSTFCFNVTDLAGSGYTYDPASDVPQTPPAVCGPGVFNFAHVPDAYELRVIDGNPHRFRSSVSFSLPQRGRVSVHVFDAQGRRVTTLVDAEFLPGEHIQEWYGRDESGRSVPNGMYFVMLDAGGQQRIVKRLAVVR